MQHAEHIQEQHTCTRGETCATEPREAAELTQLKDGADLEYRTTMQQRPTATAPATHHQRSLPSFALGSNPPFGGSYLTQQAAGHGNILARTVLLRVSRPQLPVRKDEVGACVASVVSSKCSLLREVGANDELFG